MVAASPHGHQVPDTPWGPAKLPACLSPASASNHVGVTGQEKALHPTLSAFLTKKPPWRDSCGSRNTEQTRQEDTALLPPEPEARLLCLPWPAPTPPPPWPTAPSPGYKQLQGSAR